VDSLEFLVNDLSIHSQFSGLESFKNSIENVMKIRRILAQYGRALFCHKDLLFAKIAPGIIMPQAINALDKNKRTALLGWMTKSGPFWEDVRMHSPDEWLEYNNDIVTDSAVGETAWGCFIGNQRNLVSFTPSDWEFSPVEVKWINNKNVQEIIQVKNFWDSENIEEYLKKVQPPLRSWPQLESEAKGKFNKLIFTSGSFKPLRGLPFVSSSAYRIFFILSILNKLKNSFNEDSERTSEGHAIYQEFFTGKSGKGGRGSIFSDSSDSEKQDFKSNLTFQHPEKENETIFCPMHGKIQTPQMRVHFSWPVRANQPLYVVYIGEKITKR
jgi:hypothetical protein